METVTIHTDFIKLQDLLKLTHQVSSGGEGKIVIQEGQVCVNGETCTMRGKNCIPAMWVLSGPPRRLWPGRHEGQYPFPAAVPQLSGAGLFL